MRVCLVTPHPVDSAHGNGVTAGRWADILSGLGHTVRVAPRYDGGQADLLLALHARRGAEAVLRFHEHLPGRPIVLALTGTDLYPALDRSDLPVLRAADRLVVLQPGGLAAVPAGLRDRVRVIYQSVPPPATAGSPDPDHFDVVLLAHLRPVKDPLLAAAAARLLPGESRVRISHAGAVLDAELGELVGRESRENPRYRWLHALPRDEALALLSASRLALLTSRHEGGANATSEALAAGVPILATRVAGTVGLLGEDYPGYVEPGDPVGLARLLRRAETDAAWYAGLRRRCAELRPLVDPRREREAWRSLLAELVATRRRT